MRPTAAQEAILNQIVDYGFSISAIEETISIVATIAFKESTFGDNLINPDSNARGLFQYMPQRWEERYSRLNRESTSDQIVAMYADINYFRSRYSEHISSGVIAGTMTFPEYARACHFGGPFHPERFGSRKDIVDDILSFNDKRLILALHLE